MSDFNWCHGPECHTYVTTDRVRGSKGHKVLRTKKVTNRYGKSMYGNGGAHIWDFFCNHSCLMNYMTKHSNEVVAIAPVNKPKETPIKDPTKEQQEGWGGRIFYNTKITKKEVENN